MSELNVILIHGKDTNPSQKWYPWLINEMKNRGIKCLAPELPKPNEPVLKEWLDEIDKLKPDGNSILIGHSRVGVAILRWLQKQPQDTKVKKVILVAANNPSVSEKNKKANTHGFYEEGPYDFDKIKNHCDEFVVLHSKDDEWVPFESGKKNAKGLNAKFLIFENVGHFGSRMPEQEILELLNEILS
jgi:predicted alpha/beta hydrolase family esterase